MVSKFFKKDFLPNELFKLKNDIQTRLLKENQNKLENLKIVDLTESNPTLCNFDYSAVDLNRLFCKEDNYYYIPSPNGTEELRNAVYNYYFIRYNDTGKTFDFSKDNLFFTSGTSESYSHIFRILCNSGDNILIPRPGYPLIYYIAEINSFKVRYYNLKYNQNEWKIDFNSIRRSITKKSKCIVAINPNNPTGNYLKEEEINELIKICEDYGLYLIVDEVFYDYNFILNNKVDIKLFSDKSVTSFILNGFSKLAALPQMKLGWIYFNSDKTFEEKIRTSLEFICDTYLSVSTPILNAAPKIFKIYEIIQKQIKERLHRNLNFLKEVERNSKRIKLLSYEGGWYAVIRLKDKFDDDDFAIRILKEKYIFIHPGYFYDFKNDGYIVLSMILPETDFIKGIKGILQIFN